MKRSTRRIAINLVLFLAVLSIVLLLGRSSESDRRFSWTRVQYKGVSGSLSGARGICPGLKDTTKPPLVVARVADDGNSEWVQGLADKYNICMYTADAPLNLSSFELQVPANRGHEAMAYLTFMIDNYDEIPEAGVVFIHGSRFAWHNDQLKYDNAVLLRDLNVSAALEPYGYHNLRCDWSASTCEGTVKPQGSWETRSRAVMEPLNQRVVSDAGLPSALAVLFGGNERDASVMLGRGDIIRSQCCAQFVVSKKNVHQHNKEEYLALRQWLLDGSQGDLSGMQSTIAAPADDRVAGRILSYIWHILFLPHQDMVGTSLKSLNDMACPSARDCYCRLYGRCKLSGCKDEHCPGQYRLPPGFRLPEGWVESHA